MSSLEQGGPEQGGDDIVAAEYVLGVLTAHERLAAARRIDSEPDFARLVERWEADLSPLAAAYQEVEAPASVKAALDRRLFAAASASAQTPSSASSAWSLSTRAFWRGFAVASLAAMVLYVAVPLLTQTDQMPELRLVASLAPTDSEVSYVAFYDSRTHDVGLSHVAGERADGHDFELWVIEGQQAPVSLGVIPAGANVRLTVDDATRSYIESGAVFAISLEPAGGSPTGQPTGPVVAAGDLKTI